MDKIFKVSFIYFMPVYMLMSLLQMLNVGIYVFIWYPVLLFVVVKALQLGVSKKNGISICFTSFLIYCILTGVCYSFNDTPIDCYFNGLKSFVLPMLFFYLGSYYSFTKEYKNLYVLSCLVCFVIGFYLYFATPDFYRQFLAETANNSWYNVERSEDAIIETARFSSFFNNSYAIEFLGGPLLILSFERALNGKRFKEKFLMYIVAVIALLAITLSMQRAGILLSVVFMMFYTIYIRMHAKKPIIPIVVMLVIFFSIFLYIGIGNERFSAIFEVMLERFKGIGISDVGEGRILEFGRSNEISLLFGLGVGAAGQFAGAKGLQAIFDMEYVKDFYEFGLFGFTILLIIFSLTLIRGVRQFYEYRTEMCVILYFLLCSLISNGLTQYINCAFFWYCIGRVWKSKDQTQKSRQWYSLHKLKTCNS